MKSIGLYASISVLLFSAGIGCVSGGPETSTSEVGLGTVVLPLVGKAESGVQYKLRDAVFDVVPNRRYYPYCDPSTGFCMVTGMADAGSATSEMIVGVAGKNVGAAGKVVKGGSGGGGTGGTTPGPVALVLNSEDNPDAASIKVKLEQADYSIILRNGWRMEKIVDGNAQPVEATILNSNYQYIYVTRHQTSTVAFEFGIGDRAIWVNGEIDIRIKPYEDPDRYFGPWKTQAPNSSAACKAMADEYSAGYVGAGTDCLCNKCMWDYGSCMVEENCNAVLACAMDNRCTDYSCMWNSCSDLMSKTYDSYYMAESTIWCGSSAGCFPRTDDDGGTPGTPDVDAGVLPPPIK